MRQCPVVLWQREKIEEGLSFGSHCCIAHIHKLDFDLVVREQHITSSAKPEKPTQEHVVFALDVMSEPS